MPTSSPSGRHDASARRPLLAVLTAAFILLQPVAFIFPAAATAQTTRRSAIERVTASKRPAARTARPVSTGAAEGDTTAPAVPSPNIVISQLYGGAGCGTAGCSTYKNDYIELFNRSASPVTLTNWSVQYAAATGTAWQVTTINATIAAGGYFLVAQGAGANGVNNIPAPDVTGTVAMSATSAKVALVNTNTALSGQCGNGAASTLPASVVDFVGYGTAANCNDAGATTGGTGNAPAPSTTTADVRAANGCTDTDNNAADFTATTPTPRNSSSPTNACETAPTVSSTSPANGATGVALNADISITFSEAVNVTDPWFTISCGASGAHTAAVTGGPTTFTLNPDSDFVNSETCTVTVTGANVADQDASDPPDTMAADYVFSFTTASVTPTLSVNDVSQDEGSGGGTTAFTFTVLLSTATHGGVTYDICSADNTAQDGSNVGEDTDYSPVCLGSQTIPNGSASAQHTVNVNADSTVEPNETFFVNVANVVGANVSDGQGQGTIVNDDFVINQIHDIQGAGAASPMPGANVTTTGIVTLLKTGQNVGAASTANGFFLQTPDAGADADPNTSQGVFVFTSSAPTYTAGGAVAVGDELRVTGTVVEFNGLTEITSVTNITVIDTGNPLPTAVTLDSAILSPTAHPTQPQLEKYEGMRVAAPSLRTVAPNDNFFEIYTVLSGVARPMREPGIPVSDPVPPDPTTGTPDCCIPIWDENPERLKLDTNGRAEAPNTPYTSDVTFTSVSGPLDYSFGEYKLVPDTSLAASANMAAVAVPTPVAAEFTVASYNIENFNNNATQRQKAALTVRNLLHYPDVIGAVEIFDLADLQALRDQINNDAVAAGDPNPQYEAYLVEADGTSEDNDQDVGFLVKTSRVSVTSVSQEREEATFINPNNGQPETLHDRPPFVLDAVVDPSGADPRRVLVVVNHLRSFIDVELVTGDGPRVREKRKAQAEDLADLLNDLQAANPGVFVISVGDYNAYQFSDGYTDPIKTIKGLPTNDDEVVVDASPDLVNPDFVNLTDSLPAAEQYTFIFEGTPQALDHHVINGAARARNTRVAVARVNADFPENPAAAYASNAATPERNSDHDPVVSYYSLANAQPAGTLIISEFRFHGQNVGEETAELLAGGGADAPGGPRAPGSAAENDEFIEFYNNTDSDITVSTIDGSPGWALVASDGQVRFIIPNGTVIPARRHFLAANTDGYSLFDYSLPDPVLLPDGLSPAAGYNLDILDGSGIALFRTANPSFFTPDERLDAVGYASVPELYREGAGLAAGAEVGSELEHAWLRKMCDFVQGLGCTTPGTPKDTGVNASDFVSVDTTGVTQSLGAPGPEGLSSPAQRNADFGFTLLDNQRTNTQAPNRVRDLLDTGEERQFGTMSIRRTVTNNTGGPVDYLAFRIVQITTFPAPSGVADLRALDSGDITVTLTDGTEVDVRGTYVEQPPQQPNGGALNSSIGVGYINLNGNMLEDGESVNVQFLLGVEKTGLFRFFINIEVFDACECPDPAGPATSSPASESTPEWLTNLKKKLRTSLQNAPRPKARGGNRQN